MIRFAAVAFVAIVVVSCGGDQPPDRAADDPSAAVMGAALAHLVANDHTFGAGPPPFTEYLVQSDLDPAAGMPGEPGAVRALTDDERAAVETALEDFGPVRWIDDPDEWQTDDLAPSVEGAAILGLGEPDIEGERALVPVSLWCGGLCGHWLTYVVEPVDGTWQVTGTEGPVTIS